MPTGFMAIGTASLWACRAGGTCMLYIRGNGLGPSTRSLLDQEISPGYTIYLPEGGVSRQGFVN